MEKLKNFIEEHNNIPYFSWAARIWDFKLYKNDNEKIIDNAKVWYSIYWIESLEELKNTKRNIIVVIPALTWNSKVFDLKASQWSGWANTYWKPWNILDPNKNIIIGLDYFWWPYDSSCPKKHDLNFYPVPPEKQVEAWKKALTKLWVKDIYALFWGSNWWGHIHNWVFDRKYEPKYLIPVAWPIAPTEKAKEFFSLQIDFIKNKEDVSKRLEKNLKNLKWKSELYDKLISGTKKEIKETLIKWENKKAMKVLRQIWFLKFLNPGFFDKFYLDKDWNKLHNLDEAKDNMMSYFEKEWIKFEKRFCLASLSLLLEWIVEADRISPKGYTKKISEKINIIVISIEDDNLFEYHPMKNYFEKVIKNREEKWDSWKVIFETIESNSETKMSGHDWFLWPKIMQIISNKILKYIK